MTDPEVHIQKTVLSRLAVNALFNSTFDGGSTVPSKNDPIQLEVTKATQGDFLVSTSTSNHSILFYSILFYSILFYSILFYSILCTYLYTAPLAVKANQRRHPVR